MKYTKQLKHDLIQRMVEADPNPAHFEISQDEVIALLDAIHEWIPVSQLPAVKVDTLFICAIKLDGGKWRIDARTYFAESKMFNGWGVEYYMPLPEPPEVL